MRHVYYTAEHINSWLLEIARQMYMNEYKPAYIVGLSRGGLVPALKLSHYLNIPMFALNKDESNLWMAEDAFNFISEEFQFRKNILIVDDINDTGKTLNALKEDWMSGCHPNSNDWNNIWHTNVKFATLIDNTASPFKVDFCGYEINKETNPEWCVFPWEQWW